MARIGKMFFAAILISGCADAAPQCREGLAPMTVAELYFGRGAISDAEWSDFVDREITPRFPDGLTIEDAYGQWKSPSGAIAREVAKHLILVVKGRVPAAKLEAVRSAYKSRFHQQSVLLVEHRACGSF